jgi:hypothetical protein
MDELEFVDSDRNLPSSIVFCLQRRTSTVSGQLASSLGLKEATLGCGFLSVFVL